MKQRYFIAAGLIGLIALFALFVVTGWPQQDTAIAADEQGERSITVTGSAEKFATPNIAYLDIGVLTQGADLKTVQDENAEKMDAVLKTVKDMGVAEEDIQTSGFYVTPQYDNDTRTKVAGYEVNHTMRLALRDLGQAGEVLDAAVQNGANTAGGITFDLDQNEKEALYQEALKAAIDEGEGKAKAIADRVGVQVGQPVHVREGVDSGGMPMIERAAQMDAAGGTSFEPGEMAVHASVTLVYHMN